jgi:hypothetical protein
MAAIKLGLGRYINVSVHRDIFSDDLRIDTLNEISILPFFYKMRMTKIYLCLQLNIKVIEWKSMTEVM